MSDRSPSFDAIQSGFLAAPLDSSKTRRHRHK
jgi:hypothetical protein